MGEIRLEGYADADGMSLQNRKAISVDGGVVSWPSKQQEIVALSTTEAEYIALTYAGKEAMWTRHFIVELFTPRTGSLTIYNDNQSALALAHAELGQFHARSYYLFPFTLFLVRSDSPSSYICFYCI
jgi:hypothetical protein